MLFLLPIMVCGFTVPTTKPPTTQVPVTAPPTTTAPVTQPPSTPTPGTQPPTTPATTLPPAIDYCDTRLCSAGAANIGCNNNGQMACTGTKTPFTASDIQLTLDAHNSLRQKIASGGEAGFSAAERMATMVSIATNQ